MFRQLLVPLDGSSLAEEALGTAAVIARAANSPIDLATVLEPLAFGGFDDAPWSTAEWVARQHYVEATARELSAGASVNATGTVLRGSPAEKLSERARTIGADLIVMTSHGRTGISRAWLGSVADTMIRRSEAPVLVLRPEAHPMHPSLLHRSFAHVLVPLDGSALATDILPAAIALATTTKARMTLLRIVSPLPLISAYETTLPLGYAPFIRDQEATAKYAATVRKELESTAAHLSETTGLAVDAKVVIDDKAAQAIVDFTRATAADLVAMSTHGRGASRVLIGSVSDKVLRSCNVSVLMHRPAALGQKATLVDERAVETELPALAKS